MALGRPLDELVVSEEKREVLLSWTGRSKSAQSHALRARIVLSCAAGWGIRRWPPIIGKWCRRFILRRMAGLLDEPRLGTPGKLRDSEIERVIARTLETKSVGLTDTQNDKATEPTLPRHRERAPGRRRRKRTRLADMGARYRRGS